MIYDSGVLAAAAKGSIQLMSRTVVMNAQNDVSSLSSESVLPLYSGIKSTEQYWNICASSLSELCLLRLLTPYKHSTNNMQSLHCQLVERLRTDETRNNGATHSRLS